MFIFDRPLRVLVLPATLDVDGGLPVGIDDDLNGFFVQPFGELRYEKLGSSVILGRNCNKWRRKQGYIHSNPASLEAMYDGYRVIS